MYLVLCRGRHKRTQLDSTVLLVGMIHSMSTNRVLILLFWLFRLAPRAFVVTHCWNIPMFCTKLNTVVKDHVFLLKQSRFCAHVSACVSLPTCRISSTRIPSGNFQPFWHAHIFVGWHSIEHRKPFSGIVPSLNPNHRVTAAQSLYRLLHALRHQTTVAQVNVLKTLCLSAGSRSCFLCFQILCSMFLKPSFLILSNFLSVKWSSTCINLNLSSKVERRFRVYRCDLERVQIPAERPWIVVDVLTLERLCVPQDVKGRGLINTNLKLKHSKKAILTTNTLYL